MGTRYRWAVLALGVLAQASFTTYSQGLASLGPVFRGQLGISLVSGLLCGLWIRTPPGAQAAGSAPGKRSPLADPRIWRLALGGSLLVAGQLTLVNYLVLFLNEHRHWAPAAAAAVLAVIQFGGAGSRVLGGFWSDRRGERLGLMRLVALAGALILAAVALLADAPAWLLVPLLLVTGIVSMSSNGLGFTATGEIAGHARAATAMGFQNTALFVTGTVAPIGFGVLVTVAGWPAGFAALALLAAAGWLVLRPLERLEEGGWTGAAEMEFGDGARV